MMRNPKAHRRNSPNLVRLETSVTRVSTHDSDVEHLDRLIKLGVLREELGNAAAVRNEFPWQIPTSLTETLAEDRGIGCEIVRRFSARAPLQVVGLDRRHAVATERERSAVICLLALC